MSESTRVCSLLGAVVRRWCWGALILVAVFVADVAVAPQPALGGDFECCCQCESGSAFNCNKCICTIDVGASCEEICNNICVTTSGCTSGSVVGCGQCTATGGNLCCDNSYCSEACATPTPTATPTSTPTATPTATAEPRGCCELPDDCINDVIRPDCEDGLWIVNGVCGIDCLDVTAA